MKIAVLSGCLDNYLPLAETTIFKNKRDYCSFRGYDLHLCRGTVDPYNDPSSHAAGFSWSRLHMMLELVRCGQYDWVYCVGCDTMITNYMIGLEDLIDAAGKPNGHLPQITLALPPAVPPYVDHQNRNVNYTPDGRTHVIFACDRASVVQADSFLIRGSEQGMSYLQDILHYYPDYKTKNWVEQQTMSDRRHEHASITVIVPQCWMNSYDYGLYEHMGPYYYEGLDCYGNRGQWQPGDFLIHWPATSLEMRLRLAKKYDAEAIQ